MVMNEKYEVLGLAKPLINLDKSCRKEKGIVALKNIMDKGWYLRKGG